MIAIIDYGIGNVGSIKNMLKKIGAEAKLVDNAQELSSADKIILPGVGSFDSGMIKLKTSGLIPAIQKHALFDKKPLLGICLGMQMLGRKSEEGIELGLGFIEFDNKLFEFNNDNNLKIPHMGWDLIKIKDKENPLTLDLEENQRYYFVHSYHAVCDNQENVLMECDYGYPFAAAVRHGNIYGVQFHPEKSHKYGMSLLDNFARRV